MRKLWLAATPRHILAAPRVITIAVSLIAFLLISVRPLHAELTLFIGQSGSSVVATLNGSVDTTDLTLLSVGNGIAMQAFIDPGAGEIALWDSAPYTADLYTGITGPSSWGPGGLTFASDPATGIDILFYGCCGMLYLPSGYTSGSAISGSATWDSTTLSGLGLTPGTYTYTWGAGSHADSIDVQIGSAAAPEPGHLGLMSLVVLAMAFRLLRPRVALKL